MICLIVATPYLSSSSDPLLDQYRVHLSSRLYLSYEIRVNSSINNNALYTTLPHYLWF
jgi:hypothetical protein